MGTTKYTLLTDMANKLSTQFKPPSLTAAYSISVGKAFRSRYLDLPTNLSNPRLCRRHRVAETTNVATVVSRLQAISAKITSVLSSLLEA